MMRRIAAFVILILSGCTAEIPTSPLTAVQSDVHAAASGKRRSAPPNVAIAPQCADPAPYLAHSERAPMYIVVYKAGVDPIVTTARFAAEYNFTPRFVYQYALRGFASVLSVQTVAALRCKPEVSFIEEDVYGGFADTR